MRLDRRRVVLPWHRLGIDAPSSASSNRNPMPRQNDTAHVAAYAAQDHRAPAQQRREIGVSNSCARLSPLPLLLLAVQSLTYCLVFAVLHCVQHAFHHLESHLDKTPNEYIQVGAI